MGRDPSSDGAPAASSALPGGPDLGGPDLGGPDLGGPDLGGPDLGGPDLGGPDVGPFDGESDVSPPAMAPEEAAAASAAADRPATYGDIFSSRAYRHLFGAFVLSLIGDQLSKVALAVLVFDRTRSAALAAATYAVAFVPWIVGGPLLSAYADRLPRRQVMIACDLGRMATVASLAIPGIPVWGLIAIMFATNLLSPPFSSARAAMMPDLLEGDRYVVANGLDSLVRQLAQVFGFLIGGAAAAGLRPQGALLADSVTFLVSALLVWRGVQSAPAAAAGMKERFSVVRDTAAGVRIVFGDRTLRAYVSLFWVASLFAYAYEGIAVPFSESLGGGAPGAGLLLAAGPLGLALSAALLVRVVSPTTRMKLLMPFAVLSMLALAPVVFMHSLSPVLAMVFLAGFGSGFVSPLNALFVRAVPTEYRGRAFGVAQSGVQALQGLAMLAAGLLVDGLDVPPTVVIGWGGIIGTVVVGGLAFALWPRDDFHRGRAAPAAAVAPNAA